MLALVVALAGIFAAADVAEYREVVVNHGFILGLGMTLPSEAYTWMKPWWVWPLTVGVGLLGMALSALVARPRFPFPAHPLATFRS